MTFRLLMFRLLGIASVLAAVSIRTQAATNFTAINGDWNVAGNWSPATIPNNATTDVVIGTNAAAQVATLSIAASARTLQVNSGDTLRIPDQGTLTLAGNAGVATVNLAGNLVLGSQQISGGNRVSVSAASIVLSGGGTLTLSGGNFYSDFSTIENINCKINGFGIYGRTEAATGDGHGTRLIFRGTATADVPGRELGLYAKLGQFDNFGTLGAINGATLFCGNGYENDFLQPSQRLMTNAGTISAGAASRAYVPFLSGGTLLTTGTGTITAIGLKNCTNGGNTFLYTRSQLEGTVSNNGTLTHAGGTTLNPSSLIAQDLTLTGGGTLVLGANSTFSVGSGSGLFTNVNNTILGEGTIGWQMRMLNQGTLRVKSATTTLNIIPNDLNLGQFSNTGTLSAPVGTLEILRSGGTGTLSSQSGTISVGSTGFFRSDTLVNAGTVICNGTAVISSMNAAEISGAGTLIVGTLANTNHFDVTTLSISSGEMTAAASTKASRTLQLSMVGHLGIDALVIDYTTPSQAFAVQSMLAAGKLRRPAAAAADATLSLGFIEASAYGQSAFKGVALDGTAIVISATKTGDANLDGTVNSTDFAALVGSFGAISNANWWQGDFDYNGKVNTLDFNVLAGNFGQTLPAPSATLGAVVPEPSTLLLGVAPLVGMSLRRRGRR